MEEKYARVSLQGSSRVDFNLFQAIVEQAPDGIIFVDYEGAIRIWNRRAEAVFGYIASEVLGSSPDMIIRKGQESDSMRTPSPCTLANRGKH